MAFSIPLALSTSYWNLMSMSSLLQNPIWREKYRPRKPRFFNRVHTVSIIYWTLLLSVVITGASEGSNYHFVYLWCMNAQIAMELFIKVFTELRWWVHSYVCMNAACWIFMIGLPMYNMYCLKECATEVMMAINLELWLAIVKDFL